MNTVRTAKHIAVAMVVILLIFDVVFWIFVYVPYKVMLAVLAVLYFISLPAALILSLMVKVIFKKVYYHR